jgi:hypothetical protein
MPRKSRAARRTRADLFFSPDVDVSPPEGQEHVTPSFSWRFRRGCASYLVDGPISEAIRKGVIKGTLPEVREDLEWTVLHVAMGQAGEAYSAPVNSAFQANRRRRNANMIRRLETFLGEFGPEIAEVEDMPATSHGTIQYNLERVIFNLSESLQQALTAYAEIPSGHPPGGGPNTDHSARAFFSVFDKWWRERANNPDQRGTSAIRDRLAGALWSDTVGYIPAGYTAQEWAKRKFRSICP